MPLLQSHSAFELLLRQRNTSIHTWKLGNLLYVGQGRPADFMLTLSIDFLTDKSEQTEQKHLTSLVLLKDV